MITEPRYTNVSAWRHIVKIPRRHAQPQMQATSSLFAAPRGPARLAKNSQKVTRAPAVHEAQCTHLVKIAEENEEFNPDLLPRSYVSKRLKDWKIYLRPSVHCTAIADVPRPNAAPRCVLHVLQLLDALKNHLNFSDSGAPQTRCISELSRLAPRAAERASGALYMRLVHNGTLAHAEKV